MSSVVEKVADTASNAINDVTNDLANTPLTGKADENKSAIDAVLSSAAEGRRLYIGNLAYPDLYTRRHFDSTPSDPRLVV
jgi:hypothetical protein